MKLRAGGVEEPDVNLTSLIDVVLLLLIFFMVSTSFVRESELSIELPEAALEQRPVEDGAIEIAVSADGRYFVDGRALVNREPRTLRRALERTLAALDGAPVGARPLTIRADADASHQAVITAMDVAARIGLTRIDIATVNPGDAGPAGD